ncbi:MAG: sulfotransferase domain-containing protein [Nitrososphaera sp.]|jgi:hypothetical protein
MANKKFNEFRRLWSDKHNNIEVFENFEKLQTTRTWLHQHKLMHKIYKRILYGLFQRHFYYLTGPLRVLPDFVIIGCQKCATTSLYDYLVQHPNIISATQKEIHYFDSNYNIGITWYKSFFPTVFSKYFIKLRKEKCITGEASPMYIFNRIVPRRMSKVLPHVKLIAILRNPIDRAYSHYNMQVKNGYEKLSFEEAISSEEKRIAGEREKEEQDENYVSVNLRDYSYLSRGLYAEQLKIWLNHFPKNQFLVIRTEDLEDDPVHTMNQIFEFLEVSTYKIHNLQKMNVGEYNTMNPSIRKMLIDYFKPHNEQLSKLLNRNFHWDK